MLVAAAILGGAVAAVGGAPSSHAAVPVDCADPQPPRAPLAVDAYGGVPAVAGETLPPGAAIPDQVIVAFDGRAPAADRNDALTVVAPDVVQREPNVPERVVEYAAGVTPGGAAAAFRPRRVGALVDGVGRDRRGHPHRRAATPRRRSPSCSRTTGSARSSTS